MPGDGSRPDHDGDRPRIVLENFAGDETERAIAQLQDAGFRREVIHVE